MKRLIRLPEVLSTTGLSRSEIYRLISLGRFPKAIPLGERANAWDSDAVQAWIRERIAAQEKLAEQRAATGRRLVEARRKLQAAA